MERKCHTFLGRSVKILPIIDHRLVYQATDSVTSLWNLPGTQGRTRFQKEERLIPGYAADAFVI